ncbi:hypothetical protein RFI_18328 [Reticulomyxa filosa]|uniref:Transmembrane protein n=1 Tax=Reticulomyxa filosa TaxID=46433 RepID=X6MY29_RETFI|nr:hypothetical protein RFI_18328 [Reticulomyxa filosa]|eukprot:ETO18915.1 hypothetical protein RFI_18328 [Reticulomyxa filosa]
MQYCARTYDEKEVHEGDIITVTVELNRLHEPWTVDLKKIVTVEAMTPPEFDRKRKEKEKQESKNDTDVGQYEDEHGLDFVDGEMDEKQRLQILRENAPVVHVNRFPFRVREKWMVMLVDKMVPAVVDQCAIPALTSKKIIDLHFRMMRGPGQYPYILVAKCDSYLGADKAVEFVVNVKPSQQVKEGTEEVTNYEIPEEEEYHPRPKWYYLWNETFWEFLLTLFLLYFIYLVLVSTSWGKQYIQPCSDWVYDNAILPITLFVASKTSPLLSPMFTVINDKTGVDIPKWWWGDDDKEKEEQDASDESESKTKDDM